MSERHLALVSVIAKESSHETDLRSWGGALPGFVCAHAIARSPCTPGHQRGCLARGRSENRVHTATIRVTTRVPHAVLLALRAGDPTS
jgi:hypothetical protein